APVRVRPRASEETIRRHQAERPHPRAHLSILAADGRARTPRRAQHDLGHRRIHPDVMVTVQMGRWAADELLEALDLGGHLGVDDAPARAGREAEMIGVAGQTARHARVPCTMRRSTVAGTPGANAPSTSRLRMCSSRSYPMRGNAWTSVASTVGVSA